MIRIYWIIPPLNFCENYPFLHSISILTLFPIVCVFRFFYYFIAVFLFVFFLFYLICVFFGKKKTLFMPISIFLILTWFNLDSISDIFFIVYFYFILPIIYIIFLFFLLYSVYLRSSKCELLRSIEFYHFCCSSIVVFLKRILCLDSP